MGKIKEFEIKVTLKNNLLKERRLALGFTQDQLAQEAGINLGDYTALEGLRMFPLMNLKVCRIPECDAPTDHRSGYLCKKHVGLPGGLDFPPKAVWKKSALRLIDYFSCQPSDLFPDVILKIDNPSSSMKLDEDLLPGIVEPELSGLLDLLRLQPVWARFRWARSPEPGLSGRLRFAWAKTIQGS
jgi:DNA-binding XRE family transcriptional regulator